MDAPNTADGTRQAKLHAAGGKGVGDGAWAGTGGGDGVKPGNSYGYKKRSDADRTIADQFCSYCADYQTRWNYCIWKGFEIGTCERTHITALSYKELQYIPVQGSCSRVEGFGQVTDPMGG